MARAYVTTPIGPITFDEKTVLYIVGGIALLYWLAKGQIKHDVKTAAQAVNPFNEANVFNKGAEIVYTTVTGSEQAPGADVYDATHNSDGTVKGGAWSPFYWLDKAIL